ncbi:MAG: hypothetical protein U0572_14785 [Phycisphaerales bacterium]
MSRLEFLASPWVSIGAALVGALWLAWALIGRKPTHPECLRCGHDLTSLASERCPECGRAVRSPRELTRRRRRPRMAISALLLFAAGLFGITQTLPAAWWIPRTPTPLLLVLAGRFFDEETTRDIAWELEDRLSFSDACVAWSEVPQWPAWEQALVEPAIERLESIFAAPGEFTTLREFAGCPRPYDDTPTPGPPPNIALDLSPEELVEQLHAAVRVRSEHCLTDWRAVLQSQGIPYTGPVPDRDGAVPHAMCLPLASGTSERDCVVRFGLDRFEGEAIWFHRDDDGRWRSVGRACAVPGPDGYRASAGDVLAHIIGDDAIVEARVHRGSGTGCFWQVSRLIDVRSGREVLEVPKLIREAPMSRRSELTTELQWPDATSTRVLDLVAHIEHGVDDTIMSRSAFVMRYERSANDQPFEPRSIRWLGPPPPGVADPQRVPLLGKWWRTSAAEIARMHGIDPSRLPEW